MIKLVRAKSHEPIRLFSMVLRACLYTLAQTLLQNDLAAFTDLDLRKSWQIGSR